MAYSDSGIVGIMGVVGIGVLSFVRDAVIINTSTHIIDHSKLKRVLLETDDSYGIEREKIYNYVSKEFDNRITDLTQNVNRKYFTQKEFRKFIDSYPFVMKYIDQCVIKCDLSYLEDKYIINMHNCSELRDCTILHKYIGNYAYFDRKTLNTLIDKNELCKDIIITRCVYGNMKLLNKTKVELVEEKQREDIYGPINKIL